MLILISGENLEAVQTIMTTTTQLLKAPHFTSLEAIPYSLRNSLIQVLTLETPDLKTLSSLGESFLEGNVKKVWVTSNKTTSINWIPKTLAFRNIKTSETAVSIEDPTSIKNYMATLRQWNYVGL